MSTPATGGPTPPAPPQVARRVAVVLVLAVVAGAVAAVVLTLLDLDPDVARLLLVAAGVGAVGAVLLATQSSPPMWATRVERPAVASGQDLRTSSYVRLIESNRTSTSPDAALRDRLRTLAEQTLAVRGGAAGGVDTGIGPRTRAVLDGPPRRVSVAELDAVLDELEAL